MTEESKQTPEDIGAGAQPGDIVAADGQVGRVIAMEEGQPVIMPFREKPHYLPTKAFVAQGAIKIIEKRFERDERDKGNERD